MKSIERESIPEAVLAWLPDGFELEAPGHGATADVAFASAGDQSVVIKRCREAPYTELLCNEHRVLRQLAVTDLPVPVPLGLHRDDDPQAPVWLVMTRLAGEPLWEVVARADEDERVQWFERLGEVLGRIHAIDVPDWMPTETPDDGPWLERTWRRATSYLRRHMARVLPRLAEAGTVPTTLMHGDFTLDNVLADGEGITGVIDWGGASAGDPRWDVTLALATEPEMQLPAKAVAAFFTGYRQAPLPEPLRDAMAKAYGWT